MFTTRHIGPARGSFWPYVHCSLHGHSHGTDTDTGVSRHCRVHIPGQAQCQPKPRARSGCWGQCAHMRVVSRSQIPGRSVQDVAAGKDRPQWRRRGNYSPWYWGNIKREGCGEYTPLVIASREGPRLLLAARWWGITTSGVRILSFLSSSSTSI